MRLFRMNRPVMDLPETAFLSYWPGEIVRHMGRPKGEGFLAGCIAEAGRDFVRIQWERSDDCSELYPVDERITDPAALAQLVKQPMPSMTQL